MLKALPIERAVITVPIAELDVEADVVIIAAVSAEEEDDEEEDLTVHLPLEVIRDTENINEERLLKRTEEKLIFKVLKLDLFLRVE